MRNASKQTKNTAKVQQSFRITKFLRNKVQKKETSISEISFRIAIS